MVRGIGRRAFQLFDFARLRLAARRPPGGRLAVEIAMARFHGPRIGGVRFSCSTSLGFASLRAGRLAAGLP
jgi:hypothetical protein